MPNKFRIVLRTLFIGAYSKEYIRANNSDYNVMIKQEIDTSIYRHCLSMLQDFEYPDNVKWFIES